MLLKTVFYSRQSSLIVFTLCLIVGVAQAADKAATPQVFAPGVISTGAEFALTFTPDGQTAFFTRRDRAKKVNHIYESHLVNGVWQAATAVPFSSDEWSDLDPSMAPDGKRLFFVSTRPRPGSDAVVPD